MTLKRRHIHQQLSVRSVAAAVICLIVCKHIKGLHMCRSPPSYAEEPALFALDCEMCATATDDKALLSLCLVDVNGEIVLQVHRLD